MRHSFYVFQTVRGHERVFLVKESFGPSRFHWWWKLGTTASADFCLHESSCFESSRLSAEDAYSRVRLQISPNKSVSYPCTSSTSTFAMLFPIWFRVLKHAHPIAPALYVISERSLAGLDEMSHDRCLRQVSFTLKSSVNHATSQASFPRSVTLPQLPSPRVAFLGAIHLVSWFSQEDRN
jgi:hypothetical protein